jgi:hypothetical protein
MTAFFSNLPFNIFHTCGLLGYTVVLQRGTADADLYVRCVENIENNHTGDVFKIVHT